MHRLTSLGWRSGLRGLVIGFCLVPLACSSGRVTVYPVGGEVFINGRPTPGALVHFHPLDKEKCRPAFATVQEDGSFQLTTYTKFDGAAAGDYAVTINWYDERRDDTETIQGPDKLQGRYLVPENSGLKVSICRGINQLPRLDLK